MKSPNPIFTHPTLQFLTRCTSIHSIKQVHAQMMTNGLALHTYPLSKLLLFSSPLASSYAVKVFDQIPDPTVFLFNTLISSLTIHHKNQNLVAFALYNRIVCNKRIRPNCYTYPSLFKACCGSLSWVRHGRALHAHVLKFLDANYDHFVGAALLGFYANCGELGEARYLFDQIIDPDVGAWNAILSAYARVPSPGSSSSVRIDDNTSLSMEGLYLFVEMQCSAVRPNEMSIVSLISACGNIGAVSQGMWAYVYVKKNDLELNRYVGTALINMYSKCGRLDLAHQVFDQLPQRDTFCYNAMIRGFAVNGFGLEALQHYENMKCQGLVPDDVTFVVALCACSHVGLVEEGRKVFDSMKEVYCVEPKLEHYGCLVDILGRAGLLEEAEGKVREMPMKANAILWRSLLGAARIHGNLEIGEAALKELIELEPQTSGNYVLLSNIYAGINQWEDVKRVRKLMKDHGVNKMPGVSLVDINGSVHEFLTGDKTHPCTEEIYLKLEEVNRRLGEYGYQARINEVLFDIEEEEKEDALS